VPKDFNSAIETAQSQFPDSQEILGLCVRGYLQLGLDNNAKDIAKKLVERFPDKPESYVTYAKAHTYNVDPNADKSDLISMLTEAANKEYDAPPIRLYGMLTQLHLTSNQSDEASQWINKIEEIEPDNRYLVNFKVSRALLKGSLPEAKQILFQYLQGAEQPIIDNLNLAQAMTEYGMLEPEVYQVILGAYQERTPHLVTRGFDLPKGFTPPEEPGIQDFLKKAFGRERFHEEEQSAYLSSGDGVFTGTHVPLAINRNTVRASGYKRQAPQKGDTGDNTPPHWRERGGGNENRGR
jgi:hypothetical protein